VQFLSSDWSTFLKETPKIERIRRKKGMRQCQRAGTSKNKVVIKISLLLVFLPWGSGVKILLKIISFSRSDQCHYQNYVITHLTRFQDS
jgi:hypothetical protein